MVEMTHNLEQMHMRESYWVPGNILARVDGDIGVELRCNFEKEATFGLRDRRKQGFGLL
jgi:hypothetical protein